MRTWLAVGGLLIFSGIALAAALGPKAPEKVRASPAPVVAAHPVAVELFTSQGCSSCPPADAVLVKLAAQSDVVAISRPVTYWDALGWKDTLARPENTALQQDYANLKLPGSGVFTPEMVVQGQTGFVGGEEARIRGEIVRLSRMPEPLLSISMRDDGGRTVRISGQGSGATLWMVALRRTARVQIGRGENGGRSIDYANVAVRDILIGGWHGGDETYQLSGGGFRLAGVDRYALLVRQGRTGPILAARYL